jgi:hypothetical protein
MDLKALSGLIRAFFDVYQELTVVGIVLPTGWFGRPYDNYYTLKSIDIDPEGDGLRLDLSYAWRLSITPLSAELSDSRQELTVTVKSGEMRAAAVKQRFSSGEVVFCVQDGEYSRASLAANGTLLQPFIR